MKDLRSWFLALALLGGATARAEMLSAVQVVVNQDVITYNQIASIVSPLLTKLPTTGDQEAAAKEAEKIQDGVIQSMVEQDLILHSFKADGYQTNLLKAFVDDYIQDDIKKHYYGDRSRLIRTLQQEGMTFEAYRAQEENKIITDYMSHQYTSPKRVIISPLKIENYYNTHQSDFKVADQVKLKMIALKPDDSGAGSAKALAEEVLRKVDSGVPFSEMASVYSAGSHRSEGGDRGWVDHQYLAPALADVAFSLKPGEHSGIIEMKDGSCYLLMVDDVRKAHVKPLTEVRDDIDRTLRDQETGRLRQRWLDRMKSKSFVRYY